MDADTGDPLAGAQVVVRGSHRGNVTNRDGYYFINNVPVGMQEITAHYLGYQTTSQDQRILAGQTMTVDFELPSEVIRTEGITAVIEREPLVTRDNTISKTRFTAEDARDLPVSGVDGVIELGAGVYEDTDRGGFIVRGGRNTEVATFVDGALVTDFRNQLAGASAAGVSGEENLGNPAGSIPVGAFAIEEVDIITGGFNAEFGHAQSGIINVVTREGGPEIRGNLRFTTDEFSPEQSYGFNALSASFSGPIVPDWLTVFGSLEATGADDFFPRAGGFNPDGAFRRIDSDGDGTFDDILANSAGSTEVILPGNRGDETRGQVKLALFLPAKAKVTGTYLFSRDQFEDYSHGVSRSQFLSSGFRTKTHDLIVNYDQQIYQTPERGLNLQVRGHWHRTHDFQGPPLSLELSRILLDRPSRCGPACDASKDSFGEDLLGYRFGDVEFFFEDSLPNSVFNLPSSSSRDPDPVFGIRGLWQTGGMVTADKDEQKERRYALRVDIDGQLNRIHRAKVGIEWTWIRLRSVDGLFGTSVLSDVYDVHPSVGAAYLSDRLDYGDLVIDLGLRWDHWNPNATFPALPGVVNCELSFDPGACIKDAPTIEARARDALAPRIGVAHPITEATQVRLSYGRFNQLPQLQHYFESHLTNFAGNRFIRYGNPRLDFVETTAFEAGITHLLSENLVLDVVGYNRDRRGAIRLDVFQPGEIDPAVGERRVFTNGDNGNVKGLDVTISKRFSNHFSTDLAWSLQWARGTTSSPIAWVAGFGRLFDPLQPGVLLAPPTEMQPEHFDRLHNLNWQFQLRFPRDFGEGEPWGAFLRNLGTFFVYNAQSGTPFTRVSKDGQPREDLGASRLPWVHSGNVRVVKGLDLASGLDLDLFVVVQNVLDRKNVLHVHGFTGRPDRDGFERDDRPIVSTEFLREGASGTFPLVVDDVLPEFRERIGSQDLNDDGVITFAEAAAVLFEARRAANGDNPENYGAPRQIRFGAEFRF